jgi:hypothetical protein
MVKPKSSVKIFLAILVSLIVLNILLPKLSRAYVYSRRSIDNYLDPNKNHQATREEIIQMQKEPQKCTKNTDCQTVCYDSLDNCRESGIRHDCNGPQLGNMYSSVFSPKLMTGAGCRSTNYGYEICQDNQCKLKVIYKSRWP